MHHPNPVVRVFIEEATIVFRDHTVQHARHGKCLNATRIAIDALAALAIKAVPLSVSLLAWNRVYDKLTIALGRMPSTEDLAFVPAAWAIGVDTRPGPDDAAHNAWPGHLVAVVQDHIIDCSAEQFSRPQRAITIPDVFVMPGVTKRFLKGKGRLGAQNPIEGSWLYYSARPDDRSFVGMSGYQRHEWNVEIAGEIVSRVAHRIGPVQRRA